MKLDCVSPMGITRVALVAGIAVTASLFADGQNTALAGGDSYNCATLDSALSGAPQVLADGATTVTAVAGDVIRITPGTGTYVVTFAASTIVASTTAASTVVVPTGGDGVYTITATASSGISVACSVGEALAGSNGLESQQKSLTNLIVNAQANNIATQVFENLSSSLGGGAPSGPQVAANGFSVNSNGLAAWLNEKEQARVERQLAQLPADQQGQLGVQPVAALYPVRDNDWNAWIKGSWVYYDGKGNSFDGHSIDLVTGIDYRLSSNVVVGLLAAYGNTDFDTVIGGAKGSFDADGYSVGPYVGIKISEHVQLDLLSAYTYSDYDSKSGTTTGEFGAHRFTAAAQLTGKWTRGNFFYEPGLRFIYAEEDQNAYTDSFGTRHSSLDVNAGRLSVGPKVGYGFTSDDGHFVKPWIAAKAEYDFSNQGSGPSSSLPDLDDVLSARLSAGVEALTTDRMKISVQGDVSGIGSGDYTAYAASARIDVPF